MTLKETEKIYNGYLEDLKKLRKTLEYPALDMHYYDFGEGDKSSSLDEFRDKKIMQLIRTVLYLANIKEDKI